MLFNGGIENDMRLRASAAFYFFYFWAVPTA